LEDLSNRPSVFLLTKPLSGGGITPIAITFMRFHSRHRKLWPWIDHREIGHAVVYEIGQALDGGRQNGCDPL